MGYLTFLLLASIVGLAPMVQAAEFELGGQLRPRFEYIDQGTLGAKPGDAKSYVTMRTRLQVKANVHTNASAFIQIQDVRTWGGEAATTAPPSITRTGTNASATGLDLHQAYIDLQDVFDMPVHLRFGRQEIAYDEHRLLGNIDWIQQGQAHDAAVIDFPLAGLAMTVFAAQTIANDTHPTLAAQLGSPANNFESFFVGLRATYSFGETEDRITPYVYFTQDPANTVPNPPTARYDHLNTIGAYFLRHLGGFRVRIDGAYQFGKYGVGQVGQQDVRAYMITASIGRRLEEAQGTEIILWYDYLSGDTDNSAASRKYTTFNTLYATNHAYYGHMDKFLNTPTTGLQDVALKLRLQPMEKVKLSIDLHQFLRARTTNQPTVDGKPAPNRNLGQEIDIDVAFPIAKATKLVAGYSHYFGRGKVSGGFPGDTTLNGNWAFAMVDMRF